MSVLNEPRVRSSLARYIDILAGKKRPKFMVSRTIPATFSLSDSTERLWELHSQLLLSYLAEEKVDDLKSRTDFCDSYSFLDLKAEIARRILESCCFCPRRCRVNRAKGEKGWCRLPRDFELSSAFLHMGEEPELVPSGTIFTNGCNLRCLHCQNWTISQQFESGIRLSPVLMAGYVERLIDAGCRNINMVGGDPTPWLWNWLETFKHVSKPVPTVWNTNTYYSEESAQLLAGFADIYLLDFKYGNDACAERISSAPGYVETCKRNHLFAKKFGELIIRVLVLPGHIDCCYRQIVEWIADNLGRETRVNIMWQYRPEWRASEVPELRRRLSQQEKEQTLEIAKSVGLCNYIT
ncbi:MAG: radical SAM protein [Candidatus Bathyarchaeia archaeon]